MLNLYYSVLESCRLLKNLQFINKEKKYYNQNLVIRDGNQVLSGVKPANSMIYIRESRRAVFLKDQKTAYQNGLDTFKWSK